MNIYKYRKYFLFTLVIYIIKLNLTYIKMSFKHYYLRVIYEILNYILFNLLFIFHNNYMK